LNYRNFDITGEAANVQHLVMNDLKLYGRNEGELERLTGFVKLYSDNIGMRFGLEKCCVLVADKGVKNKCKGVEIPGNKIVFKKFWNAQNYCVTHN